jgi:hypothetical protein
MSRPTTTLLTLTLAITLALALALPAFARKLEGVTLPDSIELGGQSLVLNGMGLREKVFIDVYVAGLYLPQKTTDARKAIDEDVPKRIDMVMKRDVSRDQLADTMRESLGKAGSAEAKAKADTLAAWMEDVSEGDHVVLDYVPGTGTTVTVKGKAKGTIPGVSFMQAVWAIYLGKNPPTDDLKNGLLGR